jgi:hypothetical protein
VLAIGCGVLAIFGGVLTIFGGALAIPSAAWWHLLRLRRAGTFGGVLAIGCGVLAILGCDWLLLAIFRCGLLTSYREQALLPRLVVTLLGRFLRLVFDLLFEHRRHQGDLLFEHRRHYGGPHLRKHVAQRRIMFVRHHRACRRRASAQESAQACTQRTQAHGPLFWAWQERNTAF